MRWIQSYLLEVGRYLPAADRDDILAELGASMAEQAHDLAGDQPPTPEQQQQVIDRLGHPMKVASGYGRPRYLIGPELFPTFLETLKVVLVVVAVIQCAVLLTAYVTTGWNTSLSGAFRGLGETLLYATGIVTIVFSVSEFFGERLNAYDEWRAIKLKPGNSSTSISRIDLITNLVSEGVFLLWWNGALRLQNWIPGTDGTLTVSLGEPWAILYWPLNVLVGAWFLLHAVVLICGVWRPATLWMEIGLGLAGLLGAGWLLLQKPLVTTAGTLSATSSITVERVVFTTIVIVAGFIAWDIFLAVRRLRRDPVEGTLAESWT